MNSESAIADSASSNPKLFRVARLPGLRALAWDEKILYAARGYELVRSPITEETIQSGLIWEHVASFHPAWWRGMTSRINLAARIFRDGFHAVAISKSGSIVAAVPGAIVFLASGERDFRITHTIQRGTRPLHIASVPDGTLFWGEYFDNAARDEVHIYSSSDQGATWHVSFTFARGAIRHVHNIVHDPWGDCLWILTGDDSGECRIIRASYDFSSVDIVLQGGQQARSAALIPMEDGLYFSSDTPSEANHIYHLNRRGCVTEVASINASSIYGCRVGNYLCFSTMIEPSSVNHDRSVRIYVHGNGQSWNSVLAWRKDHWPMKLFQYGNIILPDGNNSTPYLAATSVAVKGEDMVTSLFAVL